MALVEITVCKGVSTPCSNCNCGGEEFVASCAAGGGSSLSAVAAVKLTLSNGLSTSLSNCNWGASGAAVGGSSLNAVAAVEAASGDSRIGSALEYILIK